MSGLQFPLSDYEDKQLSIIEKHLDPSSVVLELSDEENNTCFDIINAMKQRGVIKEVGIDNCNTTYFVTGSFASFKEWIDAQNNRALLTLHKEGGTTMTFEPLSRNCEELLNEILAHRDSLNNCDLEYWQHRFEEVDGAEDDALRSRFGILSNRKMINVRWADDVPYHLSILENGLSYFEMKEMSSSKSNGSNYYTLNNVGKVNIQSIDNSVTYNVTENDLSQIEKMIEAARGLDNEELIVDSITQLRDNIGKKSFPEKYNDFMQNAANHMTVFAPFIPFLTDLIMRLPK